MTDDLREKYLAQILQLFAVLGVTKSFRFSMASIGDERDTYARGCVFTSGASKGGKMRKSLWIILTVLLVAIGVPNAHADSFAFTVNGPLSGSGTLTTDPLSLGGYLITDITGTFDGSIITALIAPRGFNGNDNELYPTSPQLDLGGLSFQTANGLDWNAACTSGVGAFCTIGNFTTGFSDVTFSAVATPEPSSLALMLLGIGFVFVMRKRIGQVFHWPLEHIAH